MNDATRRIPAQGAVPDPEDVTRVTDEQLLQTLMQQLPAYYLPVRKKSDTEVLSALLAENPAQANPRPTRRRRRKRRPDVQRWTRYAGVALLVVVLFIGGYLVGNAAMALFTIQRNIQAMQLPTAGVPGSGAVPPTHADSAASAAGMLPPDMPTLIPQTVLPPTATALPPTATALPVTATALPVTATALPPTATALPVTATALPPTATIRTSTTTALPSTATVRMTATARATATAPPVAEARVRPAVVATVPLAPVDATAAAWPPGMEPTSTATMEPTITSLPVVAAPSPVTLPSLTSGEWRSAAQVSPSATLTVPAGHAINVAANVVPSDTALNVLLMGVDQRPTETYPGRTDAIMIVHIDPQTQRVALLSLPRDLIVTIPGYGSARINAASVYGAQAGGTGGGIQLMRETVSQLLGIPIHYVVRVDFNGFIGAVDAIGGVTIDVEQELYDPSYPTMDYGYREVHFLPGPQDMDGETALIYSRIRHMDSDFERMRRQQQVIIGILEQVREQHALQQLQSVAAITTALRDYVQTDVPQEQMPALARTFGDFSLDEVERYTLDGSMVAMNVIPGDPYAQIALPGTIESLVAQLLNGPAPGNL
ncbi:MAG: LCP family protein [Chloroflexaceae bacterium]